MSTRETCFAGVFSCACSKSKQVYPIMTRQVPSFKKLTCASPSLKPPSARFSPEPADFCKPSAPIPSSHIAAARWGTASAASGAMCGTTPISRRGVPGDRLSKPARMQPMLIAHQSAARAILGLPVRGGEFGIFFSSSHRTVSTGGEEIPHYPKFTRSNARSAARFPDHRDAQPAGLRVLSIFMEPWQQKCTCSFHLSIESDIDMLDGLPRPASSVPGPSTPPGGVRRWPANGHRHLAAAADRRSTFVFLAAGAGCRCGRHRPFHRGRWLSHWGARTGARPFLMRWPG